MTKRKIECHDFHTTQEFINFLNGAEFAALLASSKNGAVAYFDQDGCICLHKSLRKHTCCNDEVCCDKHAK